MDLRDRRGTDRVLVDLGEDGARRTAEAGLHRSADRLEGHRGQLVLQAQQVVGRDVTDEVRPGRERLAELDRGGADRLEGIGVARRRRHARAEARDAGEAADGGRRVAVLLDPAQRAVASEDAAPLQQSPDMDDGGRHASAPPVREEHGRCAIRSSSPNGSRRGRP